MSKLATESPGMGQFGRWAVEPNRPRDEPAQWINNRTEFVRNYRNSVYIGVSAVARKMAMQNALVFRRTVKKSGVKLNAVKPTHPLAVLFQEVNPRDTEWDLWFYTEAWKMLTGDSFWWKARNAFGTVKEVWPIPSQWCWVIPSEKKVVSGYKVMGVFRQENMRGGGTFVPERDMVHIREPNMDWSGNGRFYGSPTIQAAASTIDIERAMFTRLYHSFKNYAPPGQIFTTDKHLNEPQLKQLYNQIVNQHSAAERYGAPMITHSNLMPKFPGGGAGVVRELDYTRSLDATLTLTLAVVGVPKAVVGLTSDTNRANMQAALLTFCHDSQTECLTSSGWVSHDKITDDTLIACYDKPSGKIVYRKPSKIHRRHYSGDMCRWKGRALDALMTPEHRCLVQTFEKPHQHQSGHRREWSVRRAGDLARDTRYRILQAARAACDAPTALRVDSLRKKNGSKKRVIEPEDLLEFIGWFVSEGHTDKNRPRFGLTQSPGENATKIDDLTNRLPFSFTKSTHSKSGVHQWCGYDTKFHEWLVANCGSDCASKKVPGFIKSWPAGSLEILLDAALRGDGRYWEASSKGKSAVYHTTSKQLADDIQEVAIKCGYRASVNQSDCQPSGNVRTRKPVRYFVYIYDVPVRTVSGHHRSVEHYDGTVWCVTVPTGFFVVRRNGSAHITGNCEQTINPRLVQNGQHLTYSIARDFAPDGSLVVKFPPCTVNDAEALRKAVETCAKFAGVTPNEIRDILLDRDNFVVGGDRPLMNAGMAEAFFGNDEGLAEDDMQQMQQAQMQQQQQSSFPAENIDAMEGDVEQESQKRANVIKALAKELSERNGHHSIAAK